MQSENWLKQFGEIHHQIKSMRDALKVAAEPHGLSVNEAIVLLTCASQATGNRGIAQHDLSRITTMSAAAVSGHLDALRQQDQVVSTRDELDRRRQIWTATPFGESTARAISSALGSATDDTEHSQESLLPAPPNQEAA